MLVVRVFEYENSLILLVNNLFFVLLINFLSHFGDSQDLPEKE